MPLKGSQFVYCHIVNGLSLSIIEGISDIHRIPQDSNGTSNIGKQDVVPAVIFFVFGGWCFHQWPQYQDHLRRQEKKQGE